MSERVRIRQGEHPEVQGVRCGVVVERSRGTVLLRTNDGQLVKVANRTLQAVAGSKRP